MLAWPSPILVRMAVLVFHTAFLLVNTLAAAQLVMGVQLVEQLFIARMMGQVMLLGLKLLPMVNPHLDHATRVIMVHQLDLVMIIVRLRSGEVSEELLVLLSIVRMMVMMDIPGLKLKRAIQPVLVVPLVIQVRLPEHVLNQVPVVFGDLLQELALLFIVLMMDMMMPLGHKLKQVKLVRELVIQVIQVHLPELVLNQVPVVFGEHFLVLAQQFIVLMMDMMLPLGHKLKLVKLLLGLAIVVITLLHLSPGHALNQVQALFGEVLQLFAMLFIARMMEPVQPLGHKPKRRVHQLPELVLLQVILVVPAELVLNQAPVVFGDQSLVQFVQPFTALLILQQQMPHGLRLKLVKLQLELAIQDIILHHLLPELAHNQDQVVLGEHLQLLAVVS
jgi:hypothetical protein